MINKIGAFLALFFFLNSAVFADTVAPTVTTVAKSNVYFPYASGFNGSRFSTINEAGSSASAASASCTVMGSMAPDSCSYTGAVVLGANHSATLTIGQMLARQAVRGSDGATLWIGIGPSYGNVFTIQTELGCVSPAVASGSNCVTTSCPSGYSLSGGQCVRPDCRPDQINNPSTGACECQSPKVEENGVCSTPCSSGYHRAVPDNGTCIADCIGMQTQGADGACKCDSKSYTGTANYSQVSSGCVGGCSVSASVGLIDPVAGVKSLLGTQAINTVTGYYYIRQSGATCSNTQYQNVTLAPVPQDTSKTGADGATPDPKNTTDNNKSPDACSGAGGSFIVVNGASKCISDTANSMDKLTVSDKTKVTTNTDGSTSTTTESTQQVCDASGVCTTKKVTNTTNMDSGGGTSGSSTTETGTGSGSGVEGDGDSKGQCAKEPNSPMCRTGAVAAGGSFASLDGDIATAKAQYVTKFNEVKAGIASLVQANFSAGVGGLPCRAPITVMGSSLELCFTKFESSLSVVGQFVILLGALASLFILFGRR